MSVLLIDADAVHRIDAAIAQARQTVTPLETIEETGKPFIDKSIVKLADRPPGYKAPMASACVEIAVGYTACISFEMQPMGLCRHLSVSIEKPGKVPSLDACKSLAILFGFREGHPGETWLEEFRPGQYAVNLVQPVSTDA